jgi:hypothetical protein
MSERKQTDVLKLNLTDMETDGNELFNFDEDLNVNFVKIDEAISELQNSNKDTTAGIPPSICKNLRVEKNGTNYLLKWCDPKDTVINDLTLCTWGGTVIVRKKDGYPETISEGEIVVNSKTRNQYQNTAFVDIVEDDTEYYYRAFPYSVNGVINYDSLNKFGDFVYEFIYNPNESNPAQSIQYTGINEDYSSAYMDYTTGKFNYGSWKDTFIMSLFKPCMLKYDGTVDYYLNPDDYSLKEDGTASDVANSDYEGNAMVEIGQFWIKTVTEGSNVHVYVANHQIDSDYHDYMHYGVDGNLKDYVYRAMFDGSNVSNKIRSISGLAICKTVAGDTQMTYARANGDNWDVDAYADRVAINYLLMLIGKSMDTQTIFGTGRYSGGSSNSNNQLNTGTLIKRGMFYGDNSNGAVKVFHIENWWGNIWKFTNGLIQKSGKLYVKMTYGTQDGSSVTGYNTTGAGYIDTGVTLSGTSGGYISGVTHVPPYGILPTVVSGSSTTYVPDGCWWSTSVTGFARFGSSPNDGLLVGAFALTVDSASSHSNWHSGVALSYK